MGDPDVQTASEHEFCTPNRKLLKIMQAGPYVAEPDTGLDAEQFESSDLHSMLGYGVQVPFRTY